MARSCSRPACSQPGVVAFGYDLTQRMVWFDSIDEQATRPAGLLCREHAEHLVLPRGWWLEDRRSEGHLFEPDAHNAGADAATPAPAESPPPAAAPPPPAAEAPSPTPELVAPELVAPELVAPAPAATGLPAPGETTAITNPAAGPATSDATASKRRTRARAAKPAEPAEGTSAEREATPKRAAPRKRAKPRPEPPQAATMEQPMLDAMLRAAVLPAAPGTPSWDPRFDAADDLNGLLQAGSPLLQRAFGHDKRSTRAS